MRGLPAMPCEPQTVARGDGLVGVFGERGKFGRFPSRPIAGVYPHCGERAQDRRLRDLGPHDASSGSRGRGPRERRVGNRPQPRRLNAFDGIARVEHERPRHCGHGEVQGDIQEDHQDEAAWKGHAPSVSAPRPRRATETQRSGNSRWGGRKAGRKCWRTIESRQFVVRTT
jgi:hypothetical protein